MYLKDKLPNNSDMDHIKIEWIPKTCERLPYFPGYRFQNMEREKETETHYIARYVSEEVLYGTTANWEGQITLQTQFGQTLYQLMSEEVGPKKWLEVGTWNGNGSTKCLLEGLSHRLNREGVHILSYEASPFYAKIAQENLSRYVDLSSQFLVLHAKLPSTLPFPKGEFIKEKLEHFMIHYEEEKYLYETAPSISCFFEPEVAILDGGEYVGYHDWESIPKTNLRHIFLDDINIEKNKCVHELLKHFTDWKCMVERKDERNGWAYWKRKW